MNDLYGLLVFLAVICAVPFVPYFLGKLFAKEDDE